MKIVRHPLAIDDLIEIVIHLRREAGQRTSRKFLLSVEDSFEFLAENPRAGREITREEIQIPHIRLWRVHKYSNYLIFYRIKNDEIEIMRILHGRQDWYALLEDFQ